jgi:ABC-type uncharacterized transport system ATPase component
MTLIRDVHTTTGVTVVMVAHSMYLVEYGTRSIHMANGRIVETLLQPETLGSPESLLQQRAVA